MGEFGKFLWDLVLTVLHAVQLLAVFFMAGMIIFDNFSENMRVLLALLPVFLASAWASGYLVWKKGADNLISECLSIILDFVSVGVYLYAGWLMTRMRGEEIFWKVYWRRRKEEWKSRT